MERERAINGANEDMHRERRERERERLRRSEMICGCRGGEN